MLRVKEIIKEKNTTMAAVAEKMGMSAPGLSMALNRNLTLDVMTRIAEALDVHISELFDRELEDTFSCPSCGARLKIVEK